MIQVARPSSVSKHKTSNRIIVGDSYQIVSELNQQVDQKNFSNRTAENMRVIEDTPIDGSEFSEYPDGINPLQAVKVLNQKFPATGNLLTLPVIALTSSHTRKIEPRTVPHHPRIRHNRNGLSFAIGVAVATSQPTILLDGDGSFLMHIQELETIEGLDYRWSHVYLMMGGMVRVSQAQGRGTSRRWWKF